ncbi:MAG: hypothetical protein UEU47_05980 [Oscillospiraceae bacterium]|nr:hypothetical protein [Oscillospiraceae bacterium]
MESSESRILARLVRVGTVMNVSGRYCRVKFRDTGIDSGWLRIVNTPPTVTSETVSPWVPAINDTVLCLYLPVENGDGFVIGGL